MEPDFLPAHLFLSYAYIMQERYEEAIAEAQYLMKNSKEYVTKFTQLLAYSYAKAGKFAEARKILDKLILHSRQAYMPPFGIAGIYDALGEAGKAFEWLDIAFETRDHWLVQLKVNPLIDEIRSDPRFASLIKKMEFESP